MNKEKLYDALCDRYKAKQSETLCNINIYFRDGVGVADHPNVVDTVDKLFEEYAEATENLKILEESRNEFIGY
tara:strand:- start:71 stop:289 length:219 start_codon:yes stop_codon:yes gene_type:complete